MVGLIGKDSMTKYLLVEVDGPRGTNAPGTTYEFYYEPIGSNILQSKTL